MSLAFDKVKEMKKLQDIWDYMKNNTTLGDIASVKRGEIKGKYRPFGICYPCAKFAKEAMIHESPGTAKCCQDCDAKEK